MSASLKKPTTLRRVLQYVGKYPFSLCGTILFAIINVVATLFIPVFFGDGIDCIIENGVLCLTAKDKVRLLPALNIPVDVLEKAVNIIKKACE